jgi:hypothetical protein
MRQEGTRDRVLPKLRPFLVWRNSKFSKDWVLLKDTQGVDNLSIVFQTMKNLGQKNDPYDVIWMPMMTHFNL